jgi:TatD DNase family protein
MRITESCLPNVVFMRFADAHIHLSDEEYGGHVEEIVGDARNADVAAMVSNSMDFATSSRSINLAEQFPHVVYAACGIHPWNARTLTEEELRRTIELIREQTDNRSLVAIGEIGLDSKYMNIWDEQMRVFMDMLRLAEELDLPVIIHSRGTTEQIVGLLPSFRLRKVLLHWFSYPMNVLDRVVDNGYSISEGPPVLYSSGIREIVARVPLANLLTETDGPVRYFKAPFDGKQTTPTFIPQVVRAIAELKKMDENDVATQVRENFEGLFGVSLN